jgi:DNA-binding PadR family transcriptional regulator
VPKDSENVYSREQILHLTKLFTKNFVRIGKGKEDSNQIYNVEITSITTSGKLDLTEEYKKQISERFANDFLDMQLLQLIGRKPAWGYKMKKIMKSDFGIDLRNGVLYPTLNLLEKKGFVSSQKDTQKGRQRKTYGLTIKGKEYLKAYLLIIKEQQKKTEEII